jgi:putative transcriptional regulator
MDKPLCSNISQVLDLKVPREILPGTILSSGYTDRGDCIGSPSTNPVRFSCPASPGPGSLPGGLPCSEPAKQMASLEAILVIQFWYGFLGVVAANPYLHSGLRTFPSVNPEATSRYNSLLLTPVQLLSPKQIRALRGREHVSQTVFANYLNVTPNLVSKWERGEKRLPVPRSSSCLWSRSTA